MRKATALVLLLGAMTLQGCSSMPKSFARTVEPGWAAIEIREGMDFEQAWQETLDVLAKKFELEMISKDGGYARTSWIHTWWKAGEVTENYRVRVVVKFSADRTKVDIKTEANYLMSGEWVLGTDTRLLQTVKTDIMGVVGRTTR